MDNIQKYVYLICFTGYLREQSKIAMDKGAEEFKLTGGKGIFKLFMCNLIISSIFTQNVSEISLKHR